MFRHEELASLFPVRGVLLYVAKWPDRRHRRVSKTFFFFFFCGGGGGKRKKRLNGLTQRCLIRHVE